MSELIIVATVFMIMMLIRNRQVYSRQKYFIRKIYKYQIGRAKQGIGLDDDPEEPYYKMPDYDEMLWKFWRRVDSWDVEL